MPDQQYEVVAVHSNVHKLSVGAVHRLFESMIDRVVHHGEDFMRLVVPKGKTMRMERAIGVHGPHDAGDVIEASVGIPPIADAEDRMARVPSPDFFSPTGRTSKDYPLFVARGTGMFGSAHAPIHSHTGGMLKLEDAGGNTIFRKQVSGQPASPFMLETFEEMTRVALPLDSARFAERVRHLYRDPTGGLP